MTVEYLKRNNAPALAYRLTNGANSAIPTVVFLTGFRSDMEGVKAVFLDEYCRKEGQNYLRFDYRGHGQSEGVFTDGTIGLWLTDALDMIDAVTTGPLILVGSSMGGWISLLIALRRPDRVQGLVGIAAAPDFTRWIKDGMNAVQRAELDKNNVFYLPNEYAEPTPIMRALLDDGDSHCLLQAPINLRCPVRLMQGKRDADVPWVTAQKIYDAIASDDKKIIWREEGDHRLSTPDDLAALADLITELSEI